MEMERAVRESEEAGDSASWVSGMENSYFLAEMPVINYRYVVLFVSQTAARVL